MKSLCCIFNYAPHYREAIYKHIDYEFNCDFYFGDRLNTTIKKMDYNLLNGYKGELENVTILGSSFKWQKGVLKLILNGKYSEFLLTGDAYYLSNWVIAFCARLTGRKIYFWTHGLKRRGEFKSRIFKLLFFLLGDNVLLYSNYSKDLMTNLGFPKKKLICFKNSLDYDKQLKVRMRLKKSRIYENHFNNDYPVVIYTGRIQKVKKIELLIKSMSLLEQKKRLSCNLIIVGSDNENVNIGDLISKYDLQNCWLYGSCYDEEIIGELIFNADVSVSPGNVGLSVVHSFTYGTPMITHDNFENQMPEFEIIENGETGAFFKENDSIDLMDKISNWLSLPKEKRELVRYKAYNQVDMYYNPYYQIKILKELVNNK